MDVPGALRDYRDVVASYRTVADVTLPSTGLIVDVRSDGAISVDAEAFDQLALAPLMLHHRFDDPRLSTLAQCYERRIIHERELEGRRLRLYVPSDPRTCFQAGRLTPDGEGPAFRRCDASGITLPALPGGVRVLGMEVARLRSDGMIILAAGADESLPDEEVFALELVHELVHHFDNEMGLPPWSSSLTHYEQRAYYIEQRLRGWYAEAEHELPLPIHFPSPHPAGEPTR